VVAVDAPAPRRSRLARSAPSILVSAGCHPHVLSALRPSVNSNPAIDYRGLFDVFAPSGPPVALLGPRAVVTGLLSSKSFPCICLHASLLASTLTSTGRGSGATQCVTGGAFLRAGLWWRFPRARVIECFQRHGLVDDSYTAANFQADQIKDHPYTTTTRPDGTEEQVRSVPGDRSRYEQPRGSCLFVQS